MTSHLVIPDPHSHPDHNNDRFEWFANLAVDLKPDVIICMGDWADLPSLCSYDKGTKGFEGRRYKHDVDHANDALERMDAPIKRQKQKLPRKVMLEGNHEHRIKRAIEHNAAQLDGMISPYDLRFREYGWDYVEYDGGTPGITVIDGVHYAHYFTSGIMGRPISGIHPAYQLLAKQYVSCTQGHTHTTDYCVRTTAGGDFIQGLVAGVGQDYHADWAGDANNLWWRGVIFKDNVEKGAYDPRWISMDTLKREYS